MQQKKEVKKFNQPRPKRKSFKSSFEKLPVASSERYRQGLCCSPNPNQKALVDGKRFCPNHHKKDSLLCVECNERLSKY